MGIIYDLPKGTIVRCDYSYGGFKPPEMVKARPAVIISPKLPHRVSLCAVVPLSGSPPERDVEYVVRVELERPLPGYEATVWWAKCDMIATVGYPRLNMFRTDRDRESNRRRYIHPRLSPGDLANVYNGVMRSLGLPVT